MTITINEGKCTGCSLCVIACPEAAVTSFVVANIDDNLCVACLECIVNCPSDAIEEVPS